MKMRKAGRFLMSMTLCLWTWWPVEAEEAQRAGRVGEVVVGVVGVVRVGEGEMAGEMERVGVKGMVGETGPEGELTADEIIERGVERKQGETMYSEVTMTIVRPTWTREVGIKNWTKGEDYSLILITSPAKDKGQAYLKRGKDLWNWLPSIDRMVKMSSSVMGQSWMGSDFTNDDMTKLASREHDYTHERLEDDTVRGMDCYKIRLVPREEAAVVWGSVVVWITKEDYIEVRSESYDEEGVLISTYNGYDIKTFGKRKIPTRLEVVPADKPDQKTVLTVHKNEFDVPMSDGFFSQQNMKRLR